MSLNLVASALALFIAIPVYAAKEKKSCEHFLADTSQIAERPLNLPSGDLLYYYQLEGIDPFNLFQEGMDPGNENPLSITNKGQLEISVGGWAFEPGKEHKEKKDLQALSYSKERQRYLISVTGEGYGYKLLINVDTKAGLAHVWMQEREKGKTSDWMLAGRYTNDPDKAQKSEDDEEDDAEDGNTSDNAIVESPVAAPSESPADLPPTPFESTADYSDFGLVGDGDDRRGVEKHLLLLSKGPTGHRLTAYNGATPFSGVLASMIVSEEIAANIASGNLKALHGATVRDGGNSFEFRPGGADFQGKARVHVTVVTPQETTEIKSCNPYKPAKISLF